MSNIDITGMRESEWSKYIRSDYVSEKSGESFSEVLTRYLDEVLEKCSIKQQDLAAAMGITSSVLSEFKSGTRKPAVYAVVLLSIAMRLTPDRSAYLLYTAGHILNDSEEHRLYKLFLYGCAFDDKYSIENIKKIILTEK